MSVFTTLMPKASCRRTLAVDVELVGVAVKAIGADAGAFAFRFALSVGRGDENVSACTGGATELGSAFVTCWISGLAADACWTVGACWIVVACGVPAASFKAVV